MVTPGSGGGSRKRTTRHLAEALPQPIESATGAREVKARYRGVCRGVARRPARATARATRTPIASAAVRGRSFGNGRESGSREAMRAWRARYGLRRLLMTGRAPRAPARRRSAQTTTGRGMARAVHCDRSVRELGGGRRRRLRRRLNAWASIAVCDRLRSALCVFNRTSGVQPIAGQRGCRRLEGT